MHLILHSETPLYQTSEFIVFIPLSAFSVHLKTFILCLPHWKTILNAAALLMEYPDMIAEAIYSKVTVSYRPSVIQGENGSILIDYISHPTQIELRLREGSRDPINGGIKEILPYSPVNNNMIYEIKNFLSLVENNGIEHEYLQYSLDTIRIIDHVLASHTSVH